MSSKQFSWPPHCYPSTWTERLLEIFFFTLVSVTSVSTVRYDGPFIAVDYLVANDVDVAATPTWFTTLSCQLRYFR
jgi:hypothetical protein